MSAAELARLADTSRQNIQNLENGKVLNPRWLPNLSKVMGYRSSDDLRNLLPPPPSEISTEKQEVSAVDRLVSQIGFKVQHLNGEALKKMGRPEEVFLFTLTDDAMGDHGRAGTKVLFDPEVKAEPGDGILVLSKGGAVACRRLKQGDLTRPGHFIAAAPNRNFQDLDSMADELQVLGVWQGPVNRRLKDA